MIAKEEIVSRSNALLDELPHLSLVELEKLVRHHNEEYFAKSAPQITDEAFDKLVEALRHEDPKSPALDEIGTGMAEAAYVAPGTQSVRHKKPMLSLDKCYEDETFFKWFEKIRGGLVAMPKIDGVACAIQYDESGRLIIAATRGDGKEGENITGNTARINDIPTKLPGEYLEQILTKDKVLEVRGEVHMKISRFKKHYAKKFVNPRNLAAGALKQKDPEKSAQYGLSFFPYDVQGTNLQSEREKFDLLGRLGFTLPELDFISESGRPERVFAHFISVRDELDFEIDGVVYRAQQVTEQNRLGNTAHHPRWAMAYKFQGESAQTELIDVQWSVGRTGVITPVAVVNPVFVSGATVARASLHNLGYLKALGIKEHTLVEIVRRGGVIPHVERVLRASGLEIVPPTQCPSCSGPAVVDGDFLHCASKNGCPKVLASRIGHFCTVADIQGFGEKLIQTLVDRGMVTSPVDLYRLKIPDLLPLDRMGMILAEKLTKEVNAKRELTLATFLTALGFEEIGPTVAENIASHYPDLGRIRSLSEEDLANIHGIGESIASSLVFGLKEDSDLIDELLKEVKIIKDEAAEGLDEAHLLFGKSVIFTGKMAKLDRKQAQKTVKEVGGKTPASVTTTTDYLVVGDEGSPLLGEGSKSTKQKTAEKLIDKGAAIEVISESAFLKIMKYPG